MSSLEVSIETASISTHYAKRDEDLRSPRFFHVEKFPTMAYRSTTIVAELDGQWTVEGNLTIRDVTLPVPLSVRLTGIVDDPSGNIRVGIHAHAQVSRRDFGLLADLERESGGMLLGKDVVITVECCYAPHLGHIHLAQDYFHACVELLYFFYAYVENFHASSRVKMMYRRLFHVYACVETYNL